MITASASWKNFWTFVVIWCGEHLRRSFGKCAMDNLWIFNRWRNRNMDQARWTTVSLYTWRHEARWRRAACTYITGVWLVFVDCAYTWWLRANPPSPEANYTLGIFIASHAGAWRTMLLTCFWACFHKMTWPCCSDFVCACSCTLRVLGIILACTFPT